MRMSGDTAYPSAIPFLSVLSLIQMLTIHLTDEKDYSLHE